MTKEQRAQLKVVASHYGFADVTAMVVSLADGEVVPLFTTRGRRKKTQESPATLEEKPRPDKSPDKSPHVSVPENCPRVSVKRLVPM